MLSKPMFEVSIHPNPTSGSTQFTYILPEQGRVNIIIFDILGKEIANLVDAWKDAGTNYLSFDASTLPQGFYTCRLIFTNSTQTRTMVRRLGNHRMTFYVGIM